MKIVLDANIIVSFLLTRGETISSIFNSWDNEAFEVLISDEIFDEVGRVLEYPKLKRYFRNFEKEALLEKLRLQAEWVEVFSKLDVVSDPKDNKYFECAIDGKADFIVSGDDHILKVRECRGIKTLNPRRFVSLLESSRLQPLSRRYHLR